jgi:uncharacterized protein YcbK (DUF882 family)
VGDLSANFSKNEFSCHCGCGTNHVNSDLVNALQLVRDALNVSIHILSGVRCEFHNAKQGGARHSQHLLGNAADIFVDSMNVKALHDFIKTNNCIFGFRGIGFYQKKGFVHVDVRKSDSLIEWNG